MDQSVATKPPYFDLAALRRETDELARKYAGQETALRKALVARLRLLVDSARLEARHQLERDGDGRACAEGLCAFQDALIKLAYEFTTTTV
jgi:[protein-PII] uridylyltransferase